MDAADRTGSRATDAADGAVGALDLNLLVALDALLAEESVTGAAARLHVSAPAMSRTLGRIRAALGDPVLVRAGRHLVPTPRAVELRPRVSAVVRQARGLLAPAPAADPAAMVRAFAVQSSDLLLAGFAARLITAVAREAPGVTLRFLPESLEGTPALRDGRLDLELGVIGHPDPETLVEPLGEVRLLAAVRADHPLATGRTKVSARAFAAAGHIGVSRQGRVRGPVDEALAARGLRRRVVAVVPGWTAALHLCRGTDLVCLAPAGTAAAFGLHTFEVPLDLPPLALGMAWHPRNDADPAHSWLRDRVRTTWNA
ncbi:LysR family transcriptional regulator [Streptomyces sp. NPDC093595]|uniref:LysR family transcriptional regulator n=1 Tax=Streptomyces sp. NPDC093595 TaxID=3366045 RepID=UPI0038225EE8